MTDSKALIERLRAKYTVTDEFSTIRRPVNPDGFEAADAIEKLEADNARLREALEGVLTGSTDIECGERVIYAGAVNAVRAALQETSHDA